MRGTKNILDYLGTVSPLHKQPLSKQVTHHLNLPTFAFCVGQPLLCLVPFARFGSLTSLPPGQHRLRSAPTAHDRRTPHATPTPFSCSLTQRGGRPASRIARRTVTPPRNSAHALTAVAQLPRSEPRMSTGRASDILATPPTRAAHPAKPAASFFTTPADHPTAAPAPPPRGAHSARGRRASGTGTVRPLGSHRPSARWDRVGPARARLLHDKLAAVETVEAVDDVPGL